MVTENPSKSTVDCAECLLLKKELCVHSFLMISEKWSADHMIKEPP